MSLPGFLQAAGPGTEGAAFLNIPVGAGPAALGSAYAASASNAYAPIYNPAGLGFLSGTEVAAQHLSYLESINYEYLSVVHPIGNSKGFGFSAQYLGTGNISATGSQGQPNGSYSDRYGAYSMVYGQKVAERLSLGITGKWINAKLADVSANAYAADLGALYKVNDRLNIASTLTNLGNQLTFENQGDSLPTSFHLGVAYQLDSHWKSMVEGICSKSGLLSGRFGTEWTPMEAIAIRAGYRSDSASNLSAIAGFSVGLGIHLLGQEFAYAWLPYGDLGDTQYFSLLLRLGPQDRKDLLHRIPTANKARPDQEMEPEYRQLVSLLEYQAPAVALDHATEPHP